MVWMALLMALLTVGMGVLQSFERRLQWPSEEERQANRLRILEYRRLRGATDRRLAEEQQDEPDVEEMARGPLA